jgi:hypothetical protein
MLKLRSPNAQVNVTFRQKGQFISFPCVACLSSQISPQPPDKTLNEHTQPLPGHQERGHSKRSKPVRLMLVVRINEECNDSHRNPPILNTIRNLLSHCKIHKQEIRLGARIDM